jgi:hypothetical protein
MVRAFADDWNKQAEIYMAIGQIFFGVVYAILAAVFIRWALSLADLRMSGRARDCGVATNVFGATSHDVCLIAEDMGPAEQ